MVFAGQQQIDITQNYMTSTMKHIQLELPNKSIRVGWFPGASQEAIERAVRTAAGLDANSSIHIETLDGITIALDDSLQDGTRLRLLTEEKISKTQPMQVPGPKPYPILGNLLELRHPGGAVGAIEGLHEKYGGLFAFYASGKRAYFCADADMVSEMYSSPEIFAKIVEGRGGLRNLADKSVGSALFTASDNDPLWHQAHRILAPAFSTAALKNYYGRLVEVADDFLNHLERLKPGESFLATDLMTRMTFEAISYAAFNQRYGAVDSVNLPPFVEAMNDVLTDAMAEPKRLLPEVFYGEARRRRVAADQIMLNEVEKIIAQRQSAMAKGEPVPTDLLQIMLTTPDTVTGQKLPSDNIRGQLIVLLIAGHETTSGMLAYALYYLWKNPQVLEKLIKEVDQVLGRDFSYKPTYEDIGRLDYTQRVLKEALRLCPPVPMIPRYITRDTTLGNGRYEVKAGERIFISLVSMQKSPKFWGEDAKDFNPDRFAPEKNNHHPHAYHPFGMGARTCIGFQFAMLEAKMVLARFIQRYTAHPKDPNYVLRHSQALTIKPQNLEMVLERRPEIKDLFPTKVEAKTTKVALKTNSDQGNHGLQMNLLYGSNMGGCRDIALELAQQARSRGYDVAVADLDDQVDQPWLTDGPVVIITSTYNGTPPDNASRFAKWLEKAPNSACTGVRFALLGCGNTQWHQTFQKFPKAIAARLVKLGGSALMDIGIADANEGYTAAVENWTTALWSALEANYGVSQDATRLDGSADSLRVDVKILSTTATPDSVGSRKAARQNSTDLMGQICVNRELRSSHTEGSTRHLEIKLPAGITYKAGDHLAVFPSNPVALVAFTIARCGLTSDTQILINALQPEWASQTEIPFGIPICVADILENYVDLAGPVTQGDLKAWAKAANCPPDQERIAAWLANFSTDISELKPQMQDLLMQVPSVKLDIASLISLRPALKPRYYSISSSPLVSPETCSLTVGVHHFASIDGKRNEGLCSNYLANRSEGDNIRLLVKNAGGNFQLPEDHTTPIILVGPGTGIAPLRGFIQERHAQKMQGISVGPIILFFGCHNEGDYLYREELEAYRDAETINLLAVAFSRKPDSPKTYVQNLLHTHANLVRDLTKQSASILICGNARTMAPDVHAAFAEILGKEMLTEIEMSGHYLQDVWASN